MQRFYSYITLMSLFCITACGGALNAKIGGNLTGLATGTTLVLINNNTDQLSLTQNGSFTFSKTLASDEAYLVTVYSQPQNQTCTVTSGSGTVTSRAKDINNIQVACVAGSPNSDAVTIKISGLAANASVLLLNNGVDPLTITGNATTAAGGTLQQYFPSAVPAGSNYNVTVKTQPPTQTCLVNSGVGTMPTSGGAQVIVTCL